MPLGLILSEGKIPTYSPSGREWATSTTANVEGGRINPGIRILPHQVSDNGLSGGRMSG